MSNRLAMAQPAPYPLRRMRHDSGLHWRVILEQGQAMTPAFPKSKQHLFVLEARGTSNHHILSALATIYGKDVSIVALAARPPKSVVESYQTA